MERNCMTCAYRYTNRCVKCSDYSLWTPKVETAGKKENGRKDDNDKLRYDLLPVNALAEITNVLTFGAKKYDEENWRKVPNLEKRYIAAAMRHIERFRAGEWLDTESKLHHLAHAASCLMFIVEGTTHE